MPRRAKPWLVQLGFNWLPAWRSSGARVTQVSADLRRMVVKLPLSRKTKNAVGTLFGGAVFASTDGPYPGLLKLALGHDYIVWDKAASIRYRRPGRSTLYAEFAVDDQEISRIRAAVAEEGETERRYLVEIRDRNGLVHATVERTVYIASKGHYSQKFAA